MRQPQDVSPSYSLDLNTQVELTPTPVSVRPGGSVWTAARDAQKVWSIRLFLVFDEIWLVLVIWLLLIDVQIYHTISSLYSFNFWTFFLSLLLMVSSEQRCLLVCSIRGEKMFGSESGVILHFVVIAKATKTQFSLPIRWRAPSWLDRGIFFSSTYSFWSHFLYGFQGRAIEIFKSYFETFRNRVFVFGMSQHFSARRCWKALRARRGIQ